LIDQPKVTGFVQPVANTFRCNSNVSTSSSLTSSGIGSMYSDSSDTKKLIKQSTSSSNNDMNLSSDLASLLFSFNGLMDQQMFQNHNGSLIMRSASSAGETITKHNMDLAAHLSIPKRAETFNGTSKDSQIDSVNLNADLVAKARIFKNSVNLSDVNSYLVDELNNNKQYNQQNNQQKQQQQSFSADSGFCVDLNHDVVDGSSNCSSMSLEHLNNEYSKQSTAKINKSQLESILRFILNDYMRLKNENEVLNKELEIKNKSIDILRNTMDECKDQLDMEKLSLQKKFNDLDNKNEVKNFI